jgi:hypothetical protein
MFYQKRFFKAKCKNQDTIEAIERSWKAFCEDFVNAPRPFIDSFLKARHQFFTFDSSGIKIKIHLLCQEANLARCYVLAAYQCPVCLPGTVSVSRQEYDRFVSSSDDLPEFTEIKKYVMLLAHKYDESKAQQDSEGLRHVHLDALLTEIQRRDMLSKRRANMLMVENERLKRSLEQTNVCETKSRRLI